jgi:S-formylglutathione hydrolase FrmB
MWVKVLRIDKELARYNETHVGHELIGLFPQINVAGKYDLECMNLPGAEPAAETWLSSDMHSYLDARLGIKESRWGIMGVSTGGWCATMLSMRHPDLYSAAVSIAGYYRPALPLTDPIKLQLAMDKKYDLTRPEAALKKTLPIYITASVGDKYSIRETRKFLAKPHPNLGITYKELPSGGHNSRVWVSLIPDAVDWLQRNVAV